MVKEIRSGLFLRTFGGKAEIMDGKTTLTADLHSWGSRTREILDNINGEIIVYSRDGVIKRWNLLSKVFSILTLKFYDLFKGKMDFTKEGLPYKKMGATFIARNGVLSTDNFLIDSPSMLVTGSGNLDIKKNEVDGYLAVSPLIALDSAIDKIPILRYILKEKKKGFLYVAYDIKGKIDDPSIEVSFVNTIGGKALEILKRIFLLPTEVFAS
jgi:uncharacterized protein YhdP